MRFGDNNNEWDSTTLSYSNILGHYYLCSFIYCGIVEPIKNISNSIPLDLGGILFYKINAVYTGYALSSNLIINSGGEIAAAEYNVSGRSKKLRRNLEKYPNFAFIFHDKRQEIANLLKFLSENKISFKQQQVDSLGVFWGFSGPSMLKNKLRYLFD